MANLLRRSGSSPIEHELRELRPAAPAKFVEALASRIQGRAGAAGLPTTPRRAAAALVLSAVAGTVFLAFGGIGYAASAAQVVASTVVTAATQVTSSNNSNNPNKTTICHATGSSTNPYVEITVSNNALPAHSDHQSGEDIIPAPATGCPTGTSGGGQYEQKTTICHRTGSSSNPWVLITVANSALPAHQAHGDIIPAPPTGCPTTNTPPVVHDLTVTPDSDHTLAATFTITDLESDTPTAQVVWKVNGTTVQTGGTSFDRTLPGHGKKGDAISVTVTPNDGVIDGTSATASFTVPNALPVVTSVQINQASPHTNDSLTASSTVTDTDGDATTTTYQWFVNGAPVATGASFSLAVAGHGGAGDAITVTAVANDGTANSAPVTSGAITVANSAPVINVSTPAAVQYSDQLTIPLTATDVDTGQTLTFTQTSAPAGVTLTDNHNGTASAHGAVASAAGTYAVTFSVSDGTLTNSKTVAVTVTKENATVVYNGATSFDKGTQVTLSAQFSQAADGSLGSLANATVDFVLTQGSTTLTVSGVAVGANGAASANAPSLAAGTWTVTVRPSAGNAFFTGPTSAPATFTVKKK